MILICTIIKDEHRDIREWALHHLQLGIDRIVLYDNDSSHGYEDELGNLTEIEIHQWPGNEEYRQRRVYEHFIGNAEWSDDWCLFIDADEFLHLEQHADIHEFVASYAGYAGVVLSWQCFGASGHITRPLEPVRQSYTTPVPVIRERHNFKSLARLSEIDFWADVHRFVPKTRALVNTRHQPIAGSAVEQLLEVAWIDHYITKSWEDYVARLKRGNITRGIRRVEHFFAYNPDLIGRAEELVGKLDFAEFPTLWNERQRELQKRYAALYAIADELDETTDTDDATFGQCCVAALIKCCQVYLDEITDDALRERMRPRFYDLMNRQIAYLNRIPRGLDGYHNTVVSIIISTPFARLVREE